MLAHHCAYLICSLHRALPVGDHDVCFGRVEAFGGPGPDEAPPPLLFFGGRYHTLGPDPAELAMDPPVTRNPPNGEPPW